MEAGHGIDAVHRALVHHAHCAAEPLVVPVLLRRLEEEADAPRQPPSSGLLGQELGRTQQARDVDIVAAGVHHARNLRGIGDLVLLLDRQGIHIGPQGDGRTRDSGRHQIGHYSCLGHTGMAGDPQLGQPAGDQLSRAVFLKSQLGMAVNLAAQGNQYVAQRLSLL